MDFVVAVFAAHVITENPILVISIYISVGWAAGNRLAVLSGSPESLEA